LTPGSGKATRATSIVAADDPFDRAAGRAITGARWISDGFGPGLIGMTGRVRLLGGTIIVGPPQGWFEVPAILPLPTPDEDR